MKSAVVTGASSGIGQAITGKLVKLGYRVYGLARRYPTTQLHDKGPLVTIASDLSKPHQVKEIGRQLAKRDKFIALLVNNAGMGRFSRHEEISAKDLEYMTNLNLLAPMLLTAQLLRVLRQNRGMVCNICSISAERATHLGAAYGATKAGLLHFGRCLFEENRKHGLRVVNLVPGMVQTQFHDHEPFGCHEEPDAHLTPECVSSALEFALSSRLGTVVRELVLEPQRKIVTTKTRSRARENGLEALIDRPSEVDPEQQS